MSKDPLFYALLITALVLLIIYWVVGEHCDEECEVCGIPLPRHCLHCPYCHSKMGEQEDDK